jgi:hypothetical protein
MMRASDFHIAGIKKTNFVVEENAELADQTAF